MPRQNFSIFLKKYLQIQIIVFIFATENKTKTQTTNKTTLKSLPIMKYEQFQRILTEMPERFNKKAEAESRAAYLRIGTFKNTEVVKSGKEYIVIKHK